MLTLADSYRVHQVKTLIEVIDLYFQKIEVNSEHYYSLQPDDIESLLSNPDLKIRIMKAELDTHEQKWGKGRL
ncbi:hypothetical protein Solca_0960 [Solitalea canadensis DSM 3403]|uniref:Uncharacterized protein n=2 Tax=Solitalea canadensis TaxID=995 RepID=H8KPW3_SOLCM|nr:hypothetical protein Solca_0960 [Solitalea canadensis DSM 3403]